MVWLLSMTAHPVEIAIGCHANDIVDDDIARSITMDHGYAHAREKMLNIPPGRKGTR